MEESNYKYEYEPWAVDHGGDFTRLVIRDQAGAVIAIFRLENIEEMIRFDLKGGWIATFYYEDKRPYYKIRGPCKFEFCDTGIVAQIDEPCHICGSRASNRRCIKCGRSVCGRDEDDADPDGKLPKHYGPCWYHDEEDKEPNICLRCRPRSDEDKAAGHRRALENSLIHNHQMTTEELVDLVSSPVDEED